MITNTLTFLFSLVALFSYFVYIIGKHGSLGFLFSAAIFLLISAFVDHVEYITIGLLIIGLTLSLYLQQYLPNKTKYEGFEGAEMPKEEEEKQEKQEEPKTDAFEGSVPATPPTTSTNAPANPAPVMDQEAVSKTVTAALSQLQESPTIKAAIQPSAAAKAGSSENFQEPSAGLFKLGELPSEMKKGPFVDVASTMTKAMSSLKPDQMAAMTAESQSLMETQKNLMGMLKSMGPVLQDGRQLLDTFGSIFGGLGGLGAGKI
jgi:hypothetical protein